MQDEIERLREQIADLEAEIYELQECDDVDLANARECIASYEYALKMFATRGLTKPSVADDDTIESYALKLDAQVRERAASALEIARKWR